MVKMGEIERKSNSANYNWSKHFYKYRMFYLMSVLIK